MEQQVTRRGRPSRPPIEVVRVVTWYYAVRRASKWSETKLEIHFDKLDRSGLGRHRGSRWNKYKAGITTPSRDLLEQVGRAFKGTLDVFDHPVWRFAVATRLDPSELRDLIEALPQEVANHFVRHGAPANSDFWLRGALDHRAITKQLLECQQEDAASHLTVLAGLLALVHDAKTRQLEEQHFEAHLAIASAAAASAQFQHDKFRCLWAWRLEALLLQSWLDTEYTEDRYSEALGGLRAITSGPLVPWAPRQTSLKLGRGPNKKEAADLHHSRGYWAGQCVLEWQLQKRSHFQSQGQC